MKIKALFLLFSFMLNSAIGLNCALNTDSDCCRESLTTSKIKYTHQLLTTINQKDSCCQTAVNDFSALAKLVPQSVKSFSPLHLYCISFNHLYAFNPLKQCKTTRQLSIHQWHHPPTPDIRIAIQSFQV